MTAITVDQFDSQMVSESDETENYEATASDYILMGGLAVHALAFGYFYTNAWAHMIVKLEVAMSKSIALNLPVSMFF